MVNTFKRNIILGLGISLAALIVSSAASYISIKKLVESDRRVNHTFSVIQEFDYILSRMKDAETGQRGYLLTGASVFLEPYQGARQDVMTHVAMVQALTVDNAAQQQDFSALEQLIAQKFAIVDGTISGKKDGASVTTATLLRGKDIMDHIRRQVHQMEQREQQLMVTRQSQVNVFSTYTPLLIVFASLVAVVVTYTFYRRMRNNLEENQRLQDELIAKEEATEKQIKIIGELAEQIAKGKYDIRIKESDLS